MSKILPFYPMCLRVNSDRQENDIYISYIIMAYHLYLMQFSKVLGSQFKGVYSLDVKN